MRLHVCKLDPIPHRDGAKAEYLAFLDGDCLHRIPRQPPNDASALRAIVERFPEVTDRTCSIDLAATGVVLGFSPEDTPAPLLDERAARAMMLAELPHEEWNAETCRPLLAAAKAFVAARPWTGWKPGERVRARYSYAHDGQSADLTCTIRLGAADHPDGPALFLEDEGDWSKLTLGKAAVPMRLTVRVTDWPDFAVRAIHDAVGVALYPRVTSVHEGCLVPTVAGHLLVLAAAMQAITQLTTGASRPTADAHTDEIDVRFSIDSPKRLPPRNVIAGHRGAARRELARGTAMVLLAATDPGPLDEVVCLLVDHVDPTARMLHVLMSSVGLGITREEAEARIDEESKAHRSKGSNRDPRAAMWAPAEVLAKLLVDQIGEEIAARLRRPLRVGVVRVLEIAKGLRECYEVEYEPNEVARARGELDENRQMREVLDRVERARDKGPPDPRPAPPFEGTWRDARRYLPVELPDTWSVREIEASGAHLVSVGDAFRFQIGAREEDGAIVVAILCHPHPDGTPVTKNEARDVLELLRGCGRFREMAILIDDQPVPMVGMRAFSAPLRTPRPVPSSVHTRGDEERARLIERTKRLLGEVVMRAQEDRRPMRDYCVIIGAEPSPRDPADGVVVTRELLAKIFQTKAQDPFDIRGRFDEPRPEAECVVFVKHDDGIEEMHVSLESLQMTTRSDA